MPNTTGVFQKPCPIFHQDRFDENLRHGEKGKEKICEYMLNLRKKLCVHTRDTPIGTPWSVCRRICPRDLKTSPRNTSRQTSSRDIGDHCLQTRAVAQLLLWSNSANTWASISGIERAWCMFSVDLSKKIDACDIVPEAAGVVVV